PLLIETGEDLDDVVVVWGRVDLGGDHPRLGDGGGEGVGRVAWPEKQRACLGRAPRKTARPPRSATRRERAARPGSRCRRGPPRTGPRPAPGAPPSSAGAASGSAGGTGSPPTPRRATAPPAAPDRRWSCSGSGCGR